MRELRISISRLFNEISGRLLIHWVQQKNILKELWYLGFKYMYSRASISYEHSWTEQSLYLIQLWWKSRCSRHKICINVNISDIKIPMGIILLNLLVNVDFKQVDSVKILHQDIMFPIDFFNLDLKNLQDIVQIWLIRVIKKYELATIWVINKFI